MARAPTPLPGVEERHRTAAYWIERAGAYGDPDALVMSAAAVADHARAVRLPVDGRPLVRSDLLAPQDPEDLLSEVNERLAYLLERLSDGRYVDHGGARLPAPVLDRFRPLASLPGPLHEFRVALEPVPLRCGPLSAGFYTPDLDLDFDRNACGRLRPEEVVLALSRRPDGMLLVRTVHSLGWVAPDALLSPPVPADTLRAAPEPSSRPLTRRAFIEEAFARLGTPYGWGDRDGGLDCSRFVLDVPAAFGLPMPRHSGRQALAGTFSVDVSKAKDGADKLRLIEAAARRGIVLLHLPGHVMLYLGATEAGVPMAIHSLHEYREPCAGGGGDARPAETRRLVDRVEVTPLSLGEGGSKGALLDRIDRLAVFGAAPGLDLAGAARVRRAAPVEIPAGRACRDSLDVRIFRSPHRPYAGAPLRIVAVSSRDLEPVALRLADPDGRMHEPEMVRLGGPPYAWPVRVDRPAPGEWTAVLGDGSRIEACKRVRVARHRSAPERREAGAPAWIPAWAWERDTENLYSAFVEQLFRRPEDGDLSWPSLQAVLRDPERNLLYDHRGLGEDERLRLEPDCADLPYYLRAYFAFKLRLPFAFRVCTRGKAGRPPSCEAQPRTNLEVVEGADDAEAFAAFARIVANTVHSGSARTLPDAEETDVYPVPLSREALRPGTVFADPYGHTLVVAAWLPQGVDRYGVLPAVDAQPDGTVARRRFWRGSFLFTPDTTGAGAGFKAWRPAVYDARAGAIVVADNAALRRPGDHVPWSDEQYRGTADDFYDRVEAGINPRPLDPHETLAALVDAFEEAVARRVVSVANGETFMTRRAGAPIGMPEGHAVFETEGPWEDYATPARDMRLLVSIDTVLGLPDAVTRAPARF
ncbi:MAG: NlpC/P60 family protein, partial [Myxococcota bacterium]|nr:NlpC/P60 family protein [Myxococcota bacterium]